MWFPCLVKIATPPNHTHTHTHTQHTHTHTTPITETSADFALHPSIDVNRQAGIYVDDLFRKAVIRQGTGVHGVKPHACGFKDILHCNKSTYHTQTHNHTHTPPHTHPHTHTPSHTPTHPHTPTHTHTLTHTHTHTLVSGGEPSSSFLLRITSEPRSSVTVEDCVVYL